ncbi:MAG: hypothetical protein ACYCOU_01420 [Sulfobacillus sp.]
MQNLLLFPGPGEEKQNGYAIFYWHGIKTLTADKHFVTACRHHGRSLDAVLIEPISLAGI